MKKYNYTDMLAYLGISSAHPGGSALTRRIISEENIIGTHSILDIGCGTGQTSAYLAKKFQCNVTALDSHATMIEKAKKRFDNENLDISLIKGDAENLSFNEKSFDYVLCESVLGFTQVNLTLPKIFNILKENGVLISVEMVTEKVLSQAEKNEIKNVYGLKHILLESEWVNLFRKQGFKKVTVSLDDKKDDYDVSAEQHSPSDYLDPELFKILEKHSHLLQKYQEKLSYRIFRCVK